MAQTRKKRSTKHRGNAAGVVETRGRTGRKLDEGERKPGARPSREDRFNRPPTWRGAVNRSVVAVVIFIAVLILFFKQNASAAIALGAFLLLLYIPMSYYTDLWLYRRRMAKKAAGG